jgi:predicted acyltransferase
MLVANSTPVAAAAASPTAAARSTAVDYFRGATVALMILVNTPGTWQYAYPPLRHADWHGCTLTDLVFPSFMFIIGVSMWFSFARYGRRLDGRAGPGEAPLWQKILRRTILLFVIGLILNNFPFLWRNWDTWRIMGVPQRLALGYGLASLLVLTLSRRALLLVSAALLLGYWGLLWLFGEPGADPYALESNAVLRLDRWLFTDQHLWHGERIAFDPEGVLSTLPAVVTVVLGWLAGNVMTQRAEQKSVLVRDLLVYGLLCMVGGLAWDLLFPMNKKLWTSSYVLFAGGISIMALAVSIWLLDVRRWRSGTGFFTVFGANALFAYIFSEALVMLLFAIRWTGAGGQAINAQQWIYRTVFEPLEGAEFSSLLFALSYVLVCWLVCYWLYLRRIFIKL